MDIWLRGTNRYGRRLQEKSGVDSADDCSGTHTSTDSHTERFADLGKSGANGDAELVIDQRDRSRYRAGRWKGGTAGLNSGESDADAHPQRTSQQERERRLFRARQIRFGPRRSRGTDEGRGIPAVLSTSARFDR